MFFLHFRTSVHKKLVPLKSSFLLPFGGLVFLLLQMICDEFYNFACLAAMRFLVLLQCIGHVVGCCMGIVWALYGHCKGLVWAL